MSARTYALTLGLALSSMTARADDPPPAIPAEEPPPAIPAAQPAPPVGGPAAIPAPGQPTAPPPDRTYQQGYTDGKGAANREPMGGWAATGAVGGCVAGPLGCLAATGAGAFIEPRYNPAYYQGQGQVGQQDYWAGYNEGYSDRLKARRATSAFVGGTVATVALTVTGIALLSGAIFMPIYID